MLNITEQYLDLSLDVLDGIAGLDLEGDGLAGQRLDEDLHASPQPQDQVKGGLLLDVVIGEGPAVLQLLASEDQPLLVRGDALLILNKIIEMANLPFLGNAFLSTS